MTKNKFKTLFPFFLILPIFAVACHGSDISNNAKLIDHDMTRATIDIELPTALWDRIEAVSKPTIKPKQEPKAEKKPEGKGESAPGTEEPDSLLSEDVSKEYVPLTVRLIEKPDNKGILQSHDHQLFFGAGGGVLDLADFVENRRGSYYLQIELGKGKADENNNTVQKDFSKETVKVFYLSNSRRRKWDRKIIGSGCYKYYDITSFFDKSMKTNGFLLNTTDHLDVTTIGGSFFFAAQINKTLYISQLSIKDSRFHSIQCRPMLSKVESL